MSGDKKLEMEKKAIQKSQELTEEEKQELTSTYLTEVKNSEGITSGHTLAKHLQKMRHIMENNPGTDLTQVEISEEFSRKIRDQIQRSQYKKTLGDYARRSKQDYWTIYRYWIKYVRKQSPDQKCPKAKFTSDKNMVDIQADTRPEDLPTAQDMRKLLNTLQSVSHSKTGLRNAAFYGLIWDLGTRKNETLPLQMKDVDINQNRVRIYVTGNKGADSDWVRLFQTEQLFREYIQTHPSSDDPEAYLFPDMYHNKTDRHVTGQSLKKKMLQARTQAGLQFKTYGEPFHIFRKASSTFYVVNEIISWEEVCKRQRKKPDSTKPDYILRAMEDVEQSTAEGLGLETENTETRGVMTGTPLLPKKCEACQTVNNCLRDSCTQCQATLPENSLPTPELDIEEQEERMAERELIGQIKTMQKMIDKLGIDEDIIK